MIRWILPAAVIVSLAACSSEVSNEGTPTASSELSPGGISYTLIHVPEDDVAIHVAWPTDWAYREDTNKAAPLVGAELMLAGGAQGYPAGDVGERWADLNAGGNLYGVASDHIVGELVFEREDISEVVEIANAHLREPLLGQTWLNRISDGVEQSVNEERSQPAAAGFEAVRWTVLGEQPLRNALSLQGGNAFEALSRDDILAWHAETFTRTPEAVTVAGDIDAEAAGQALDSLLKGLPEKGRSLARGVKTDFKPRRILLHMPEAEVSSLAFVAPVPPTRLGGEIEDALLIDALGGDDQSVLFNAMRTHLRASYAFGAGMDNLTGDHRVMSMAGEVDTSKIAEAESVVREAYRKFRKTGMEGDIVERKVPLEAYFSEINDHVMDLARVELQSSLDGGDPGRVLRIMDEIEAVTDVSLNERLKDAFPEMDEFTVIAVSPEADSLPDACVITTPREAVDCLYSDGVYSDGYHPTQARVGAL
ncbi:M16 family metallopeptidase [Halomonas organivorans]|uniref:Putative Zn-dependent peptidase n=1 Tax=Halomonas organivorans TaxID=257772 RepID=A0A7W5BZB6_9GAMM|nr:insulinase family protein [Halomonas organivorans]MBB3141781.1 putative Zn-dependent peptidase [Halomonas organivorans]